MRGAAVSQHEPLESLERRLDRAANRLSFGVIVGSLVIGASIVTALEVGPRYAGVSVPGPIGDALAALLGLMWAVAVRRSGRF